MVIWLNLITLMRSFKNPQHDYTKSLLNAIPIPNPKGREERKKKRKLNKD